MELHVVCSHKNNKISAVASSSVIQSDVVSPDSEETESSTDRVGL